MLSEELIKSLGLYVNHEVCLQTANGEELLTGNLLGYTKDEVILATGEAEERLSFDKLEDIFYKGYITSYQREDRTGRIDDTYSFRAEACLGYNAERELLRYSEYDYGVCCHLVPIQDRSCVGGVRISARDVTLEQEPYHVLPMAMLENEMFLYKLRRREDQIGVLEQKGTKYAVCYEGKKTTYFDRNAISEILRCPKVNDYVTVLYEEKDICGVVAFVEMNHFGVFTGEDTVRIPYEECKRIRYWGRVKEETLKPGEKQFLIDGVYPITENRRKGYGQGRGKTGLKHGMTVSFVLGINKNGYYVREYSVEEEKRSLKVGVITSFDSTGKGYIGTLYERGVELREVEAKAFFLEEDMKEQITLDLQHYVYVVKYNTCNRRDYRGLLRCKYRNCMTVLL